MNDNWESKLGIRTFIKDLSFSLEGGSWWGPGKCLLMSLKKIHNTTRAKGVREIPPK